MSRLPNYKPHKMCYYKPASTDGENVRLAHVWPRLYDAAFAEAMAVGFLQQQGHKRLGADEALAHRYFADLPQQLHYLDDGNQVDTMFGKYGQDGKKKCMANLRTP